MGKVIKQERGENWNAYNADCVEVMRSLPDESIHFSMFSPPFAALYVYSNSDRDLGNCLDEVEFFEHFKFVIKELYRIIKAGRVVAVHCMEMPRLKQRDGFIGVYDFRGDIVRHFESAGFQYDGSVTIWKNPVTAMQRTKSIRLLHKQIKKDSTVSGWALPDYVCKFKKPGVNSEPVEGEFDRWFGDDSFNSEGRLSIDIWQKYASPVWMDIDPSDTLQYRSAKGEKDERHICPLQKQPVERCLQLWTNPGDIVFDPFGGIGTVVHCAVVAGRKGLQSELKGCYHDEAIKNCRLAEQVARNRSLFDRPLLAEFDTDEVATVPPGGDDSGDSFFG